MERLASFYSLIMESPASSLPIPLRIATTVTAVVILPLCFYYLLFGDRDDVPDRSIIPILPILKSSTSFIKSMWSKWQQRRRQRQRTRKQGSSSTKSYPASTKCLTCDAPNCHVKDPKFTRRNQYLGYYYCSMNCLKSMEYHQIQQMKKVQDAQRQHSAALQLANDHEDNNNGGHGVETIPVTVELVAENQTCAICLDDLNIQHHLIGLAHCKHVFCFTCLANYQKHSNVNEPLIRGAGASGTTGNANGNANDEYIAPPDHEGLPTDQEMMEWHERQIQNEVQGNGGRPDPTSSTSTSKCPCCRTNMPDLRSLYLNRISITLAQMANMTSMTTTTMTTTQESLWKRTEQYMKALESLKETKVNLQVMKLKAKGIYLMGNYTVSLQHYQELVDKCQEQIQRREELMELHQQWQMQRILASTLSQREEVIRSFRKLQKELVKGLPVLSESDVIDVRLEMNSVRMAMGQWTETISSLKQVIRDAGDELTPNQYRRIFMAFSKCLFETQQYALAIDAGQAGVEMNRFFPGVYTYIGKSHLALGNIKLANQAFCCAVHYEAPWDEDHRMKTQEQYDVFRSEVDFDDEEEEE